MLALAHTEPCTATARAGAYCCASCHSRRCKASGSSCPCTPGPECSTKKRPSSRSRGCPPRSSACRCRSAAAMRARCSGRWRACCQPRQWRCQPQNLWSSVASSCTLRCASHFALPAHVPCCAAHDAPAPTKASGVTSNTFAVHASVRVPRRVAIVWRIVAESARSRAGGRAGRE